MRKVFVTLFLLVVLAGVSYGAWWWTHRSDTGVLAFKTVAVKKGDLTATIAATGTIQPEETVDVGAQVAGRIVEFGKDADDKLVDYRSHVEENMLLATIDDEVYKTNVASAKAQLANAEAGVERSKADMEVAKAKKFQAEQDWVRAQKLGPSEALAANSYDAYKADFEAAVAQLSVSSAQIKQAEAQVELAQASVAKADRELKYCTILSPVTGTVISRRVNVGQTVVASLNAPSLFLIAKDLKRIEVLVPVNEADIGQVKPDQLVQFTVETFPGRQFVGKVGKIRLEPTITQNVVTYPVEIVTENKDETLLPYLTANVKFVTSKRENVLYVPNAALRYTPMASSIVPEAREKYAKAEADAAAGASAAPGGGGSKGEGGTGGEGGGKRMRQGGGEGRPGGEGGGNADASKGDAAKGGEGDKGGEGSKGGGRKRGGGKSGASVVWVEAGNGLVKPIEIKTGMSDGVNTEVLSEELTDGMAIVAGDTRNATTAEAAPSAGTNPFAPSFPKKGR